MVENAAPDGRRNMALAVRLIGWCNLAVLAAFLISNFLTHGLKWPGAALFAPASGLLAWIQFSLYPLALLLAVYYVLNLRDIPLRMDAERISSINRFIIRAAFWGILFVGIVDLVISFLRVENYLQAIFGENLARELGRSHFRGLYVHVPLLGLGIVLAVFTRTLGFLWLGLMIVVAELLIVISRFIFSYEQAFMGDLVRFWYGALFLFASAYTLIEEGHVRVDVFYAGFSVKTKGIVNAIGTLTMGLVFCWTIIIIGMGSGASIINAPIFNFETSPTGSGMFIKYMMAGFLGLFAVSMMIQFAAYLFEAVADWRGDPGHVDHEAMGYS